jgi:hypothetical protein
MYNIHENCAVTLSQTSITRENITFLLYFLTSKNYIFKFSLSKTCIKYKLHHTYIVKFK